jgi:hypothetical protein
MFEIGHGAAVAAMTCRSHESYRIRGRPTRTDKRIGAAFCILGLIILIVLIIKRWGRSEGFR